MNKNLPILPRFRVLPRLYRLILWLSRKHGLFTLSRLHSRFFGGDQYVDIPTGARLFIPGDPHYFGFLSGVHETHVTKIIEATVRKGDVCVDIGANIGYFAMIMAKAAGAEGRVYAFEPVPETFSALANNALLAKEDGLDIYPQQAAISANEGELVIDHQQHSTLNQVRTVDSEFDSLENRVRCMTLARFLAQENITGPIVLLKIDVEGHEVSVIKGALPVLKSGQVKTLIIEVTPGDDAVHLDELFQECRASALVWEGGSWQNISIKGLQNRTDVLVTFTF